MIGMGGRLFRNTQVLGVAFDALIRQSAGVSSCKQAAYDRRTKKSIETKLWSIANTLRGKMNADEFRDYALGFIFYKYLSERMHPVKNGKISL